MSGVGALGGEEVLGLLLVFVGISEVDLDEGTASSGVVEHSSHHAAHVALALGEVEVAISGRSDPLGLGSRVDAALLALALAYARRKSYIG